MNHFVDHNFIGKSSSEGKLTIIRSDVFFDFLKRNKGKTFYGNIWFINEQASSPHRGYYFKYVLPIVANGMFRVGYIERLQDAEECIREISPICWEESYSEEGKLFKRLREIHELSDQELSFHISYLKKKAASWLKVYINDKFEL